MCKKLLILPFLVALLFSCNQQPEAEQDPFDKPFTIQEFYNAIESRNFTASDGELSHIYIGNDILKIQSTGQIDTAVVRMKQGIFEIYKTDNGYNSHGMVTPNKEMDITDSLYNFYRIVYLRQIYWSYNKTSDTFSIKTNIVHRDALLDTGFIASGEYQYISNVTLKRNIETHGYDFNVNFIESSKIESYTIAITNIGKNSDRELENYIKNTTLSAQTEWNSYQLSALEEFGLIEAPFLNSYTLGLKLYFQQVYAGEYALIVYDYLSNKSKETDIVNELVILGFTNEANQASDIKKYSKPSLITGYKFVIEFRFVPVEEIEGEANKQAFPYGYMQVMYSYVVAKNETTLEALNSDMEKMQLTGLPTSESIKKVETIDYAGLMNSSIYEDEFIEAFNELGIEPGPLYEEYRSILLSIDKKTEAVTYLDNYRQTIRDANYISSELIDDTKSIDETSGNSAAYFKYDSSSDVFPMYEIYMYLNDSTTQQWSGVVEIVIIKLTDLGVYFYSQLG